MCRALKEQGLRELANKVFNSEVSEGQTSSLKAFGVFANGRLHQVHQKHKGYLADIDMQFITEELGKDWKSFGGIIGLKEPEIERIEMDFSPPTVETSLEMQVKWRERQNTEVNHLREMCDTLEELGKATGAKELRKYYLIQKIMKEHL